MNRRIGDVEEYLGFDGLQTRLRTHATYSEVHDDVEAAVLEHADPPADVGVLDIGRHGYAQPAAGRHHGRIVGCDLSPEAVRAAAALADVGACQADATRLPFGDAEFELVMARRMLYHSARRRGGDPRGPWVLAPADPSS